MICIPIIEETTDEVIRAMKEAFVLADLVEIRVDYIKDPDLEKILAAKKKPIIITITPKDENSRFKGSEQERIALLSRAVELGADYIDVNYGCSALNSLLENRKSTRIIVSVHNFKETPEGLDLIYEQLKKTGADIIKIATFANRLSDNIRIFDLIRKRDRDIIAICMGPKGEISRVLAPVLGSFLTFASLDSGRESAPGQIPARVLKDIYRINDVHAGCAVYGIIGNPVNKSRGFVLHNGLFRHHGMNKVYVNFPVVDLPDFMEGFTGMLEGFSITMPYKQAVIDCLDEIDPLAARIGAVNTVVIRDGKLKGYNTDITGALRAIEERTEIKGRAVTILGAGGAARAIAVGVAEKGGRLTILNRTVEKAEKLAMELNCHFGAITDFKNITTEILINVTSVGMYPEIDCAPVNTEDVRDMVVFDAVYNPEKTKLLRCAEENNCAIISGMEMFINQAAEQFRLWTGIWPDSGLIRKILKCS